MFKANNHIYKKHGFSKHDKKNTGVQCLLPYLFPWEGFPKQTCISQGGWKHGCKPMDHFQNSLDIFRVSYHTSFAPALRGARVMRTNTMQRSKHVKVTPKWLFHEGCLSLHSWQTAMLATAGTLNSSFLRKLSLPHLSFIGTIASIAWRGSTTFSFSGSTGLLNSPKTKIINGIMLMVFPCPFVHVSLWRCNLETTDWIVVPGAWVPNPLNADGCTPVAFWGLGFGKVKALLRKPRHQHLLVGDPLNSVG